MIPYCRFGNFSNMNLKGIMSGDFPSPVYLPNNLLVPIIMPRND
jgi:hypothetical protein